MFPHTVTPALPEHVINQAASLTAEERLELFLSYVSKAGEVWTLVGTDGYVMMEAAEGSALPVWPHQQLVQCWYRTQHTDASPSAIPLNEFVETWLPGLAKNQTNVVVFPASENSAEMVMTADELKLSITESDK